MIRQPSSYAQLYRWWLDVTSGAAGRLDGWHVDDPHCGYYRTKMVTGGPWVPVRIVCERDIDPDTGELTAPERLVALVEGDRRDPAPMWTFLEPITAEAFATLEARIASDPNMAASRARLDLSATPTLPPRRR